MTNGFETPMTECQQSLDLINKCTTNVRLKRVSRIEAGGRTFNGTDLATTQPILGNRNLIDHGADIVHYELRRSHPHHQKFTVDLITIPSP